MDETDAISPILLTGATGHTGRRLARRLAESGYEVRALSHNPEHLERIPQHPNVTIVRGSADNAADLERLAQGVATAINIAHIRYAPGIVRALERSGKPARLIVMSSTRLLSRYETPIREVVREGEKATRQAAGKVRWTILRPSMIYGGPDDNNIERMARALKKWPIAPVVGSGRNLWQPVFVWDLVDAIVAALESPEAVGKTYTLAGPEPMSYRDIVRAVARASGAREPLFLRIPRWLALAGAAAFRATRPRSGVFEAVQRFGEDRAFDIEEARRDLGFRPTPFDEGLRRKFRGEA